ncbi:MAG TPA: PIN domain-containing protein [Acidimicrobiia bacterium]
MAPGTPGASKAHPDRGALLSLLLLDTTVLISFERGDPGLDAAIADDDDAAVAAVTIAELAAGVKLASGRRRTRREAFLADILETLPIIPYDLAVARSHTDLLVAVRKGGVPRGAHDLIIAATALASHRELVTADARGFSGLPGLRVRSV